LKVKQRCPDPSDKVLMLALSLTLSASLVPYLDACQVLAFSELLLMAYC